MLEQIRASKPLPEAGLSFDTIKSQFAQIALPEPHAHFARAFRGPPDVQAVAKYAFEHFMSDNGFFSLYLPYMQQIEQEVIEAALARYGAHIGRAAAALGVGQSTLYKRMRKSAS